VIGFSGRNPRTARAPGAENASQEGASFFPSRVFYPLHSRHRGRRQRCRPISGAVPPVNWVAFSAPRASCGAERQQSVNEEAEAYSE
jgi:hypothetical protein